MFPLFLTYKSSCQCVLSILTRKKRSELKKDLTFFKGRFVSTQKWPSPTTQHTDDTCNVFNHFEMFIWLVYSRAEVSSVFESQQTVWWEWRRCSDQPYLLVRIVMSILPTIDSNCRWVFWDCVVDVANPFPFLARSLSRSSLPQIFGLFRLPSQRFGESKAFWNVMSHTKFALLQWCFSQKKKRFFYQPLRLDSHNIVFVSHSTKDCREQWRIQLYDQRMIDQKKDNSIVTLRRSL